MDISTLDSQSLQRATAMWRADLEDAAGRQSLVNFHDTGADTLNLGSAHPSGLAGFLAGRSTQLSNLFRQPSALDDALRRARAIRVTVSHLEERHGLNAAYVSSGIARWTTEDPKTGEPQLIKAPVLLHPVSLRSVAGPRGDEQLDLASDVQMNPALVRLLKREEVDFDPAELERMTEGAHGFNPRPAYNYLRDRARHLPDFVVVERTILGVFLDVLPDLIDGITGLTPDGTDPEIHAVANFALGACETAQCVLPEDTPAVLPTGVPDPILPLDPDQRAAYVTSMSGSSTRVVSGAGTGATQLITNIAAATVAAGGKVLLAAARPRDIQDVRNALGDVGLDYLLDDRLAVTASHIDLEHAANRSLDGNASEMTPQQAAMRLVDWRLAMTERPEPWRASLSDAMDEITALECAVPRPATTVRLRGGTLIRMDRHTVAHVHHLLAELGKQGGFEDSIRTSGWAPAYLAGDEDARKAVEAVSRLSAGSLSRYVKDVADLARTVGLSPATTLAGCRSIVQLVCDVAETSETFLGEVYQRSLPDMVAATATKQWRDERGITMGLGERRKWRRQAKSLLQPKARVKDLHEALVRAHNERQLWQKLASAGGWPAPHAEAEKLSRKETSVLADVQKLDDVLDVSGVGLFDQPLTALQETVEKLAKDAAGQGLPDRVRLGSALSQLGLGDFLKDIQERRVPAKRVAAEFDYCWWRSVFDALEEQHELPASYQELQDQWRDAMAATHADARAQLRSRVGNEPRIVAATPLRLAEVVEESDFDLVIVAGAHSVAVPEGVVAMLRGERRLIVGDPAGTQPMGLDESIERAAARTSLLDATVGAMPTVALTHQHRMPAQLARFGMGAPQHVVPTPVDPVSLLHVPSRSHQRGDTLADREVTAVVSAVLAHIDHQPAQSLAVVTLTRRHARAIADAVREEVMKNPSAMAWFRRNLREPFVVTDMYRCEDVVRDRVILSLGIAPTVDYPLERLLGSLDKPGATRAFAAAMVRARAQLTVATSIEREDVHNGDSRSSLAGLIDRLLQTIGEPWDGTAHDEEPLSLTYREFAAALGAQGFDVLVPGGHDGWPDLTVSCRDEQPVALLAAPALTGPQAFGAAHGAPDDVAVMRERLEERIADEMAHAVHLERFGWIPLTVTGWDVFTTPARASARVREAAAGEALKARSEVSHNG